MPEQGRDVGKSQIRSQTKPERTSSAPSSLQQAFLALVWSSPRRRLWGAITLLGLVVFAVWQSIPDENKSSFIRSLSDAVAPTSNRAELSIRPFTVVDPSDEEMGWLRVKAERKLVEFFSDSGLRVSHDLSGVSPAGNAEHYLEGSISRKQKALTLDVSLRRNGIVVSSATLEGELSVLDRIYSQFAKAIIYGMDVDPRTLTPLNSKSRPTQSVKSYALYLAARKSASSKEYNEAIQLLDLAIENDPEFAMAYWAKGELVGLYGCDLRLEVASDGNSDEAIIHKFRDEFKTQKKECALLIVRAANDSEKWTTAGFSDEGEFRTIVSDDPTHDLWKELKKAPVNEIRITALARSILGRTRLSGEARRGEELKGVARRIDRDHPKYPIHLSVENPMPSLLARSLKSRWKQVADGLGTWHVALPKYNLSVHAWKFNPTLYEISVVDQLHEKGSTAPEFREEYGGILAINGGFFEIDPEDRLWPSGLLIVSQHKRHSYKESAGSGVLYQRNGGIGLDWSRNRSNYLGSTSAVQSGPFVVDPGGKNGIYKNDYDRRKRSAVCLTENEVLLIAVVGEGLSLFQLGEFLAKAPAEGGFGCRRALNLDGGASTQVSFAFRGHTTEIEGTWKIQNAIIVKERSPAASSH